MCFAKVFEIPFSLPKILSSLLLLKFLLACIMINLIGLVVLLASLVIISLSLLNQYVANACNHQVILMNYFSGPTVIFNLSWFSANQIADGCTPKSILLVHP